MPIIAFATSKGGAGKTTAAVALATQLAKRGVKVTLVDCDPERWAYSWGQGAFEGGWMPESLSVVQAPDDENALPDAIDEYQSQSTFVILDLEGSANLAVGYAIASSDLVIIPMRASGMDGQAASKTMKLVATQQKMQRREIPMAVLFSATSVVVRTKLQAGLASGLQGANVKVLQTELVDRVAFREMLSRSCPLEALGSDVSGVSKAIDNAAAFAGEVVTLIKQSSASEKTENDENVRNAA